MTLTDTLSITAIFLGPILAIQVQKWIERTKEHASRRLNIFKTLMATRGAPLSYAHVEALNMIEIEFYPYKKYSKIIDQWRIYLDHLGSGPKDRTSPSYQSEFTTWGVKNNEHLIELLFIMSKFFKYTFDKVTLKKGIYTPQGHADTELEQKFIRNGLINILLGTKTIPISIKDNDMNTTIMS